MKKIDYSKFNPKLGQRMRTVEKKMSWRERGSIGRKVRMRARMPRGLRYLVHDTIHYRLHPDPYGAEEFMP